MDQQEIREAVDRSYARAQRLPLVILGIIAEATLQPGHGSYIASWSIAKRLESLRYEDVSMGSRIPGTVYDYALKQLIGQNIVEELPDLPMRYRLKTAQSGQDHS